MPRETADIEHRGLLLGYTSEVAGYSLAAVDVGDKIRALTVRTQDVPPGRAVIARFDHGREGHPPSWRLKEVSRERALERGM